MAIRASPKLFQRNIPNITRSLNTAIPIVDSDTLQRVSSSSTNKSIERSIGNTFHKPGNSTTAGYLDLNDGKQLFSSMSTSSLFRSLVNLHMASFEPMVDIGIWVMKSKLIENIITKKIILNVVKHTFYEHFCAGENLGEAGRTLQRLWDDGLKGIIDYGLEDADDNASCDRNLNEFFKTVESTKLLPPSSVSYACVKITAICPKPLLERVSDLLRWEHKNPLFKLPWKAETLPALSNASPLYHTLTEPEPLTPVEEQDLHFAYQRLLKLSEKCQENNLPLLVDAEYSSVQPAIDYLTYSCMVQINRNENPIVYGTIQAYFKDAKERLLQATEAAEKMGVGYGVKLVRGAYYSSETQIASSLGFPSPIHDSIDSTHACYNECASIMINKVLKGTGAVLLATHNLHSERVAAKAADELGVGKMNQNLQFAQLKGMADGLSFALKNAGFQVSKYLPYGPVEMIMPYLLRRAEENRGMLSASSVDRNLMRNELARRVKTTFVGDDCEKTATAAVADKN